MSKLLNCCSQKHCDFMMAKFFAKEAKEEQTLINHIFRPNLFYSQKADETMLVVHEKKQSPITSLPPSSLCPLPKLLKPPEYLHYQLSAGVYREMCGPKFRQLGINLLAHPTMRNSPQNNYNQGQQIHPAATEGNMQMMFVINHLF